MIPVFTITALVLILPVLHSYLLYPMLLKFLARKRPMSNAQWPPNDPALPRVFILFAAYNEEAVITEKLDSLLALDYPADKLFIHVGSDASDDRTEEIVANYASEHAHIQLHAYRDRGGKANVINRLKEDIAAADGFDRSDVLVLTDANIIFNLEVIHRMVRHFKDPAIGQVGANVRNRGMRKEGISGQEQYYIQRENRIKEDEGRWAGVMMGAFGACYAIRQELFPPLRTNFLMEDFYVSMHVLKRGYRAILDPDALVTEDLPMASSEEFKRKLRISAGNYQNLSVYASLLWPPWRALGFAFLSHKVIRWITPFLLLMLFIVSLAGAWQGNLLLQGLLFLQLLALCCVPIDQLASKIGLHWLILRYPAYFIAMNLALMAGFFKYLKGVRTTVWQPTQRDGYSTEHD